MIHALRYLITGDMNSSPFDKAVPPIMKICLFPLMDVKIWMLSLIIMFALHPICIQDSIFNKHCIPYASRTPFSTNIASHMHPGLHFQQTLHPICIRDSIFKTSSMNPESVIIFLLMPWLPVSPGHQLPYTHFLHSVCQIGKFERQFATMCQVSVTENDIYIVIFPQYQEQVDSFLLSAAYIRRWTGSAVDLIMACRLFSTKPLPWPMLTCFQLDSREQVSVKLELEFYYFHSRKCVWKCRLPKWRPFCPWGDELPGIIFSLRN